MTFISFPCMVNVLYSIYVYRLYLPCDVHTMNDKKKKKRSDVPLDICLSTCCLSSPFLSRLKKQTDINGCTPKLCAHNILFPTPAQSFEFHYRSFRQNLKVWPQRGSQRQSLGLVPPFLLSVSGSHLSLQDHSGDIPGAGLGGTGLLH